MADFFSRYYFMLFLINIIILGGVEGGYRDDDNEGCKISKCGTNGPVIRFPFRLEPNQPKHCGYPGFELSCNHMNQTVLQLPVDVKVEVVHIDYRFQDIILHDPNNCFPAQLPNLNFSGTPFSQNDLDDFALFNCSPANKSESSDYITLVSCLSGRTYQVYAAHYGYGDLSDELTSCVKISNFSSIPYYFFDYKQGDMLRLFWSQPDCLVCEDKRKWCTWNATTHEIECLKFPKSGESNKFRLTAAGKKRLFIVLGAVILFLTVIALYFIYNSIKRNQEDQVKVKRFLEDYKALKPSRYSFYDIKKITNNFKEKLGMGAYGTVFKGKLSNEIFVAVKVLESSLENGAEFIKEVGTMATIHHVNVVRLVGFCADGIKQALIYEFCANESLEKFIFSETSKNNFLGWERLPEIASGIVRGIEYLHQGSDRQILHFDIKPHNILLNHNFNPKITDFGLAKLCAKDQCKVSMTKARGIMSYIAPEVFSRNFGDVSNKSDVFSFGMLLLEMVGGRKKINLAVPNSNQTYLPELIYDRLIRGEWLGIRFDEQHAEITKQLGLIGLWCIQWNHANRPSMKTVVQMIEGNGDALTMPPNPFPSHIQSLIRPLRGFNVELEVIFEAE